MSAQGEVAIPSMQEIEGPALTAYNTSNALLMALEGLGKHSIDPQDEIRALNELALTVRNANADLCKAFGLRD